MSDSPHFTYDSDGNRFINMDYLFPPSALLHLVPVVIQGPTEDIPCEDVTPKQLEEK